MFVQLVHLFFLIGLCYNAQPEAPWSKSKYSDNMSNHLGLNPGCVGKMFFLFTHIMHEYVDRPSAYKPRQRKMVSGCKCSDGGYFLAAPLRYDFSSCEMLK